MEQPYVWVGCFCCRRNCDATRIKWKTSFLDCLVSRENNELSTTVYRKPTHTDRLLDEWYYNPTSHKTNYNDLTRRAQLVQFRQFVTHRTAYETETNTLNVFFSGTTTMLRNLNTRLTEVKRLDKRATINDDANKPQHWLGLCSMFDLQYKLFSTTDSGKLVQTTFIHDENETTNKRTSNRST